MVKNKHRSVLDLPVQVSDDGSVIVCYNIEQWDLRRDADETGWQGRSIPKSSVFGSKLGTPSRSTGLRSTSTARRGAVIGYRAAAAAAACAV